MPSIYFTRDEIGCILGNMQMELDDWEDYHPPESAALMQSVVDKIRRSMLMREGEKWPVARWNLWDAWRAGVREAWMEDGMTFTPDMHHNFAEMNEWYDRGKNFGRRARGVRIAD